MKKQIAAAVLIGALVAAGGMLWQEPTFGATPDIEAAFSPDGGAERLVLRTIYGAQQSVRVMAYSFTAAPVVKALLDAKRRGIDVAVTVDYRSNIDEDRSGKAAAALRALVYAGIPVRLVRAFAMQHSKFIVTDRATVETGAYTITPRRRGSIRRMWWCCQTIPRLVRRSFATGRRSAQQARCIAHADA